MFQRVELIGNLGQDPELRQTPNGNPVCTISVATSKRVKKGDQWEPKTEWHRVVIWGLQAENVAKYTRKGSKVFVEGELETRMWEKDGHKNYTTEIVAHNVRFLDKKEEKDYSYTGGGTKMDPSITSTQPAGLDEIPF